METETDNNSNKYINFFNVIADVITLQNEQKKRGLNDYNLLTSVLKAGDEVRLHSRFLFSMLNPNGAHFQGDLFLKLFFELVLGETKTNYINNFEVKREKDNIDLLITNGEKYYIIENKVFAQDQPRQIARYVHIVKNEYNADINNIFVYYLSPKNTPPSRLSLGKFQIIKNKHEPDFLHWDSSYSFEEKDKYKVDEELDKFFNSKTNVSYKKIGYHSEILNWINSCLIETENLTNLNFAFSTYKDVIEQVIKTRTSKVATISDMLIKNPKQLLIAREVEKALLIAKGELLFNFFNYITEKSGTELEAYPEKLQLQSYSLKRCTDWFDSSKKKRKMIGLIIKLSHEKYNLCVMAASKKLHIGLISKDGEPLNELPEDTENILIHREWTSFPNWYSTTPIKDDYLFNFDEPSIAFITDNNEITTFINKIKSISDKK